MRTEEKLQHDQRVVREALRQMVAEGLAKPKLIRFWDADGNHYDKKIYHVKPEVNVKKSRIPKTAQQPTMEGTEATIPTGAPAV